MRVRRRDDGQAVVEFTLMLPFFLLLIMLLVEFGFMFYSFVTVRNATAEAARFAAVAVPEPGDCTTAGTIQSRAVETGGGWLTCDNTAFNIQYATTNPPRGSGVSVELEYTYTPVTIVPGLWQVLSWGLFPAEFTLRSCSDARLESDMNTTVSPPYSTGPGTCEG